MGRYTWFGQDWGQREGRVYRVCGCLRLFDYLIRMACVTCPYRAQRDVDGGGAARPPPSAVNRRRRSRDCRSAGALRVTGFVCET